MALDHQIEIARNEFNIDKPEDWQLIRPEWILQVQGCGPKTVDHIRLYLAGRGLTLRDDATPAYWQQHLESASIGSSIAKTDKAIVSPFVILVDEQEKRPFTFQGFRGDASEGGRPMIVQTEIKTLGPTHGDYSLKGYEREVHVERKSPADALGTFLAAPGTERHTRWEATLAFLAACPSSAVVIECTIGQMIMLAESRGKRSVATLRKTVFRQVLAWADDYRVPFHFMDDRRLAETATLAILRRYYRHAQNEQKSNRELDTAIADL